MQHIIIYRIISVTYFRDEQKRKEGATAGSTELLIFTLYGVISSDKEPSLSLGTLCALLKPLGVSPEAARLALSRMARKGYFTTRRKGRLSYYFLTPKSTTIIRRAESRSVRRPAPEPWDGFFRMLSYEIPESRRDERVELATAFRQAGLGRAAAGLWASARDLPRDLRSLIEEPRFRDLVCEYRSSLVGDARAFARRVWGLDEKAAALRAFRDRYAPEAARYAELMGGGQSPPPDDSFRRCFTLVSDFVEVMACQPPLPPELLPEDWPAAAAAELYVGYRRLVSPGADEYISAVNILY